MSDPKNRAALFGFLCTVLIGSHLSNRICEEAASSETRRREIELLHQFGLRLFAKASTAELLRVIPRSIVSLFHVRSASIYLQATDTILSSGPAAASQTQDDPRHAPDPNADSLPAAPETTVLTLIAGTMPIGDVTLLVNLPSPETLIALSSLIDMALDKAATVERLAQAASERATYQLRENWPRSLSHEMSKPLSALRARVLAQDSLTARQREELLSLIDKERDHLTHCLPNPTQALTPPSGVTLPT